MTPAAILQWVFARPLLIAFGAVSIALVWQTVQRGDAENGRDLARVELASCQNRQKVQNEQIQLWSDAAEARQRFAEKAMDAAKAETITRVERSTEILSRPVPTPDMECAATLSLLKEYD